MKIISLGVWRHKRAYFRSPWNAFDFAVSVLSVPGIWFHPLRPLAAFRAISLLIKFEFTLYDSRRRERISF